MTTDQKPEFLIISLGEEEHYRRCILYHRPSAQVWLSVGLIFHVTNCTPGDIAEIHNLDRSFLYQEIAWLPLIDVAEFLSTRSSKTKQELIMATLTAVAAAEYDSSE